MSGFDTERFDHIAVSDWRSSTDRRTTMNLETVDCAACHGSGKVPKPCELCRGSGYVGKSEHGGSVDSNWVTYTQTRCPNGCPTPIARLAAGVSG